MNRRATQTAARRGASEAGGQASVAVSWAARVVRDFVRAQHQSRPHPVWMRLALLSAALALLSACGGTNPSSEPLAIPATTNTWSWVDAPGTACSDGSQTGVAVSPGTGPDVLLFLDGGGACWDYTTCFVLGLARPGPFGRAEFEANQASLPGTILDREVQGNPFTTFTLVYVPYCTGDLHAGDAVQSYSPGAGLPGRTWFHRGRANLAAVLPRLAATFPHPPRLVFAGSSAGGFGVLLNDEALHAAWPAGATFVIDDSGPPLESTALNADLRAAWRSAWNLDPFVDPFCPTCKDDFSSIVTALTTRHPTDRLALLSSLQDEVISGYFLLPQPVFQAALLVMIHDRFDPVPSARTFLVPGSDHALFQAPGRFTTQGTPLITWLTQMVGSDAAWRSVAP